MFKNYLDVELRIISDKNLARWLAVVHPKEKSPDLYTPGGTTAILERFSDDVFELLEDVLKEVL